MMRSGVVMTGRVVMMLGRRMFCHLNVLRFLGIGPDRSRGWLNREPSIWTAAPAELNPDGRARST
jgi:hypothetical protein